MTSLASWVLAQEQADPGAFLGDDLLAYLVLALGAALVAGNVAAIVRPPDRARSETDLERAPMGRSVVMAVVGLVAAIWALASLLGG
jgi:hypothetical protein